MFRQTGSARMWWGACGIIVVFFLILGVFTGIYYVIPPFGKSLPSVQILQPTQAIEIESGQAVVLTAKGESGSGIKRIDFVVNDIPINQVISNHPHEKKITAAFPWFGSQPGVHKLSVIAYDQTGTASLPDVVLVVVIPKEMGGFLTSLPQNQANGSGTTASDTEEQPSNSSTNDQIDIDQILQNIDPADNFPVNIPGQPQDLLPAITTFYIQIVRDGSRVNGIYSLGAIDDLGLAYVTIYFSSLENPLNPTNNTQVTCGGERSCAVDGQIQIPEGGWLLSAQAVDTSGQVSLMRTRQVHVLSGEGEPAIALENEGSLLQLDPNIAWDEVQFIDTAGDDLGEPRIVEYGCAGQTVVLEIPYTYASDHGDEVYVEARAESGNIMVAASNVRIGHGSGIARFEMGQILQESINTDALEVFIMASGGDYFYSEQVDFSINWPTPQPDLRIASARIGRDEQIVSIENIGCTSVEGVNLLLQPQDSEGENIFIDALIPAGGKHDWLPFANPNLFSHGYQLVIDPENAVSEIDESNNSYEVGPVTLQYVHFYKIDIHDTSEGWPEDSDYGEFGCDFIAGDAYAARPRVVGAHWRLSTGPHEIIGFLEPIYLTPNLDWTQDLFIRVACAEDDGIDAHDFVGEVEVTHSHDMLQEGNWKTAKEFSKTSSTGDFTIFWRLVVEQ